MTDTDDVELGNIDPRSSKMNLYDEAHDMLLNAFLMFCIPDLRAMAKEGVLKGDPEQIQRIVALPATLEDIVTVFGENKEAMAGRFKDEERAQMYQDALSLRKVSLDNDTKRKAMQKIFLIHFVDEKEEEECVYAVSLNHVSKRVGIYFRGSVTKKDFRQDSKAIMSAIHNPVKAHHLAEELGVHLGFREYLYSEEKLSKVWYNPGKGRAKELNKGQMKYQMILEQVHALLEDRPDYRLFIAGHSLGGALTTLMALEAGADEKIPKPVTAITCGAPKVGNLEFLRAFEELEQQKKLRFLQVANDRDPVTLSPPDTFNPCTPLFCKGRRYRHVGLRLKLRGSKGYVIYYPMKMRTYFGILCCDLMNLSRAWMFVIGFGFASLFCLSACFYLSIPMLICCGWRFLKETRNHHTQLKYMRRLEFHKDTLEQFDIDELNERRFARPRWRVPVLYAKTRAICKRRNEVDKNHHDSPRFNHDSPQFNHDSPPINHGQQTMGF